ncbi:hypothetical protein SAMN06295937_10884, partial [Sphingopyxis flava]
PQIVKIADACAVKRAEEQHVVLRNYAQTRYGVSAVVSPPEPTA